ncbi:MAG: hypothetical protein ABIF08_02315 [Nanoarchaeota archaeon]
MVPKEYKVSGRGRKLSEFGKIGSNERKDLMRILKSDINAYIIFREEFYGGIPQRDWMRLSKTERIKKLREMKKYINDFDAHLEKGEELAHNINKALAAAGYTITDALQGVEYFITQFSVRKEGELGGKLKESKVKKFKSESRPTEKYDLWVYVDHPNFGEVSVEAPDPKPSTKTKQIYKDIPNRTGIRLEATPMKGYEFDRWFSDYIKISDSTNSLLKFTINSHAKISAIFKKGENPSSPPTPPSSKKGKIKITVSGKTTIRPLKSVRLRVNVMSIDYPYDEEIWVVIKAISPHLRAYIVGPDGRTLGDYISGKPPLHLDLLVVAGEDLPKGEHEVVIEATDKYAKLHLAESRTMLDFEGGGSTVSGPGPGPGMVGPDENKEYYLTVVFKNTSSKDRSGDKNSRRVLYSAEGHSTKIGGWPPIKRLGPYPEGTIVGLTARPEDEFDHWSGADAHTDAHASIELNKNRKITAIFNGKDKDDNDNKAKKITDKVIDNTWIEGWRGSGNPITRIVGLIIFFVVGATLSAIMSSAWFFAAFSLWAFYLMIPSGVDELDHEINKIDRRYEKRRLDYKKKIVFLRRRRGRLEERLSRAQVGHQAYLLSRIRDINQDIDNLQRDIHNLTLKRNASTQQTVLSRGRTEGSYGARSAGIRSRLWISSILKMGAFISTVMGFLSSTIPLAQPIGLIIGFFLYMSLGGTRDMPE